MQKMAAIKIGGRKQSFIVNTISMCGAAPFALTASMSNSCCPFSSMPAISFLFASSIMGRNALTRSSTAPTKSLEQNSQLTEHTASYCDAARVQLKQIAVHHENEFVCFQIDGNYASDAKWRSARFGFQGLRDYLHLLHAGHCFPCDFWISGTSNAPTNAAKIQTQKIPVQGEDKPFLDVNYARVAEWRSTRL